MQSRAAVEVAATTDERDIARELVCVTAPELDVRRAALHPLLVALVNEDRNAAEGVAPFDHRRVEMRMRDGDEIEAAACLQRCDGFVGDDAEALPEDVAGVG